MHAFPVIEATESFKATDRAGFHVSEDGHLEHALPNPADMMIVNSRTHQRSCNKERFGRVNAVLVERNPVRGQVEIPDQPCASTVPYGAPV